MVSLVTNRGGFYFESIGARHNIQPQQPDFFGVRSKRFGTHQGQALLYTLVKTRYFTGSKPVGRKPITLPLTDLLSAYHLTRVDIMTVVTGHIDQAIACVIKLFTGNQQFSHGAVCLYINGCTDCPVANEGLQVNKIRMVGRQGFAAGVMLTATTDLLLQGHDVRSTLIV